jgi:hypothetical protein
MSSWPGARASLAALRAHERRHVRQYERLGPFFLPAYFLIGALIWLRGGRPYLDHPLERQAGCGNRGNRLATTGRARRSCRNEQARAGRAWFQRGGAIRA